MYVKGLELSHTRVANNENGRPPIAVVSIGYSRVVRDQPVREKDTLSFRNSQITVCKINFKQLAMTLEIIIETTLPRLIGW